MSGADRFGYAASGQLVGYFGPPPMPPLFPPEHKTVTTASETYGLAPYVGNTQDVPGVTMTPEAAKTASDNMEFEADRARRCLAWMDANAPHMGETREAYTARMQAECRTYLPSYETTHANIFGTPPTQTLTQRCQAWTVANPQGAQEPLPAWYDRMVAAIPECATAFPRPVDGAPPPGPLVPVTTTPTAMDTVRSLASNRYVQVGAVVAGGYILYRLLRK